MSRKEILKEIKETEKDEIIRNYLREKYWDESLEYAKEKYKEETKKTSKFILFFYDSKEYIGDYQKEFIDNKIKELKV